MMNNIQGESDINISYCEHLWPYINEYFIIYIYAHRKKGKGKKFLQHYHNLS